MLSQTMLDAVLHDVRLEPCHFGHQRSGTPDVVQVVPRHDGLPSQPLEALPVVFRRELPVGVEHLDAAAGQGRGDVERQVALCTAPVAKQDHRVTLQNRQARHLPAIHRHGLRIVRQGAG